MKNMSEIQSVLREESKENIMGTMPVNKLLLSLSLPMMASMLVQALIINHQANLCCGYSFYFGQCKLCLAGFSYCRADLRCIKHRLYEKSKQKGIGTPGYGS